MARSKYRVAYHVICVIYFSEGVPSGREIAQLWAALAALGDLSAEISVFRRGDTEPLDLADSPLGSPEFSEVLIASGEDIQSAGASCFWPDAHNAISDSDVNFMFDSDAICDGVEAPPMLALSVSGQVIERIGRTDVIHILRRFCDVADAFSPICGLVDVARPKDACAGMVYGAEFMANAPLARWIEHLSWLHSGARKRDRLRGLYWGNYLGPSVLERLGGREQFVETFEKNARDYDGTPNAHCWQLPKGLFVSLSLDPLDCRPTAPSGIQPAAEANLRWLLRELGTRGVLNAW
jgi:hypothetical protein